ncbi:MAG: 2OG-Fe(II) oxygenase [Flavobacteriaceae bacterium]|nr:2OG-Fe(II) oxygenase [Flavobacteriaceae bacterium]
MDLKEISDYIFANLLENKKDLTHCFNESKKGIGYFYLDNVLPEEIALQCYNVFPDPSDMRLLKSIREYKYVSAQMDKHHHLLEQVIYAFQDERIVNLIGEICDVQSLEPDEFLYAGGISLMKKDNFLNPHLDNSHDSKRERWRVLNLLYYVSPKWNLEHGGHLELWPEGPKRNPVLIESKFNRLVVMATHANSWHSVNKVVANKSRCCISNYYFSPKPMLQEDTFHVTKFRGRPDQTLTNIVLDADAALRMFIRKFFKKGIRENPHIYKKKS